MELLIALAMKFWQWSLLILLVIVGFVINLLDKKKVNIRITTLTTSKDFHKRKRILERYNFMVNFNKKLGYH